MPFTVRPATPDDVAAIAEFNSRFAWETENKRLDPPVIAAGVAAILADAQKGRYFVADARRGRGPDDDHLRMERLAQRLDLVGAERLCSG